MKTLFDLTREIAEAEGIASPKPPIYDVVFNIYKELGGAEDSFNCTYDILQAMLDEGLVSGGGGGSNIFEELKNAGYTDAEVAQVESMTEDDVALTKDWYINTSERTNFSNMFNVENTPTLAYLPHIDTSKGTNFSKFALGQTRIATIPPYDTSKGTTFDSMFDQCYSLTTVPKLDLSNATSVTGMFGSSAGRLVNIGGFTGLKINISLRYAKSLTRQSVINILTEAADLTGQSGATLTLHADVKARLTQEDYDLAASKNWTIA